MVSSGSTPSSMKKIGVKLQFLKEFYRWAGEEIKTDKGETRSIDSMETREIVAKVIAPKTNAIKASFCEYLQSTGRLDVVKEANVFVSHAWGYNFKEVIDSLDVYFAEDIKDGKEVIIWMDIFSNNQHTIGDNEFPWWVENFSHLLVGDPKTGSEGIGRMVLVLLPQWGENKKTKEKVWQCPVALTRIWCLYEIYCSTLNNGACSFDIAMKIEDQETMLALLKKDPSRTLLSIVQSVDVNNAESSPAKNFLGKSDRDQIFEQVFLKRFPQDRYASDARIQEINSIIISKICENMRSKLREGYLKARKLGNYEEFLEYSTASITLAAFFDLPIAMEEAMNIRTSEPPLRRYFQYLLKVMAKVSGHHFMDDNDLDYELVLKSDYKNQDDGMKFRVSYAFSVHKAQLLVYSGQSRKAEAMLTEWFDFVATNMKLKQDNHILKLQILARDLLIQCHLLHANYKTAEELIIKAKVDKQKLLGYQKNDLSMIFTGTQEAFLHFSQHNYIKALKKYRECVHEYSKFGNTLFLMKLKLNLARVLLQFHGDEEKLEEASVILSTLKTNCEAYYRGIDSKLAIEIDCELALLRKDLESMEVVYKQATKFFTVKDGSDVVDGKWNVDALRIQFSLVKLMYDAGYPLDPIKEQLCSIRTRLKFSYAYNPHPHIAAVLTTLGIVFSELGHVDAESTLKEALDQSQKFFMIDHPHCLTTVYALIEHYHLNNKTALAKELFNKLNEKEHRDSKRYEDIRFKLFGFRRSGLLQVPVFIPHQLLSLQVFGKQTFVFFDFMLTPFRRSSFQRGEKTDSVSRFRFALTCVAFSSNRFFGFFLSFSVVQVEKFRVSAWRLFIDWTVLLF
jgi:hypothetical protein